MKHARRSRRIAFSDVAMMEAEEEKQFRYDDIKW